MTWRMRGTAYVRTETQGIREFMDEQDEDTPWDLCTNGNAGERRVLFKYLSPTTGNVPRLAKVGNAAIRRYLCEVGVQLELRTVSSIVVVLRGDALV